MRIKEQKVKQFLEDLASTKPAPGGGAAAALAGAVAASLVEKVAGLTIGKKGYAGREAEMKRVRAQAGKNRQKLLQLAQADAEAFNRVIAAYKIPKGTKDREAKIQKALKAATQVPMETAQVSSQVGKFAKIVAQKGNRWARSDAQSAVYLAGAAVKSALENVKINLGLVGDKPWAKRIKSLIKPLT